MSNYNRNDVPDIHSFPPILKFVADDDGNQREVTYYRADMHLSFTARVEDVFRLPETIRKEKDWGIRGAG